MSQGHRSPRGAGNIVIGEPRQVVPSDAIPAAVPVLAANNNLDIATHDGRLFFAWRTAPTHFASSEAMVHVVSSDDDGRSWSHELTVRPGRDLREPRFLSFEGSLFLYWFEAGTSAVRFEPAAIFVAVRDDSGWSEPRAISGPGYVVWRPRIVAGRALMSVYAGADRLYSVRPGPTRVELWESADGLDWGPLDPDRPVCHEGGTETDYALAPGGGLVGVTRKEGPFGGWGTDVFASDDDDWLSWRVESDPRKLDSPLLFNSGGRYFVIARRQRAFGGRYDLGLRSLPPVLATRVYQGVYSATTKRTAVYEIDPVELTISWRCDLPSRGDTSFAGMVETGPGEYVVYNYSSPLEARDRVWIEGQLQETRIYSTTLSIGP